MAYNKNSNSHVYNSQNTTSSSQYRPGDSYSDIENSTIEDYRVAKSKKDLDDYDFNAYVNQSFELCYRKLQYDMVEVEHLQELYENKSPIDFFNRSLGSEAVKNRLFKSGILAKTIETRAALTTANKPKVYFNPIYKNMQQFLQNLQQGQYPEWVMQLVQASGGPEVFFDVITDNILDEWWEKEDITRLMYIQIKNAYISGKSWVKLFIENDEIKMQFIPFQFVAEDPSAITEADRQYIFHMQVLPTRKIEEMFDLDRGAILSETQFDNYLPEHQQARRDSYSSYTMDSHNSTPSENNFKIPRARLVEGWFKDDTSVDIEIPGEVLTDDNGDPVYDTKGEVITADPIIKSVPLYPNGRIITFVAGQDTESSIKILSDQIHENQYPTMIDYIAEPVTEVSGRPIARDLGTIQMNADRAMQQAEINFEMVGNARIFYNKDTINDPSKISNSVGEKIPVTNPQDINFQPGVPVISEGVGLYNIMVNAARDISGIHEAAEGRKPPSIESGKALLVLNESTNRRMAPSIRFYEKFLKKMFHNWAEMLLDIYTAGKKVRMGEEFYDVKELPFDLADYIEGFDIEIGEDTTVPQDPNTKANLYMTLMSTVSPQDGMPLCDRQTGLEALKVDRRQQIDARLKIAKQEQMQEAQVQQQSQQAQQQVQELGKQNEQLQEMLQTMQGKMSNIERDKYAKIQTTQMKAQTDKELQVMKDNSEKEQIILKGEVDKNKDV